MSDRGLMRLDAAFPWRDSPQDELETFVPFRLGQEVDAAGEDTDVIQAGSKLCGLPARAVVECKRLAPAQADDA